MIGVLFLSLVGRKMATTKDAKKTFKRIFVIIVIIITKVAATGTNLLVRYPTENQILFRDIGTVVNKLTYLHIRYVISFSTLQDTLQQSISIARKCKEEEMKRKGYKIDFSQLTSEEKGKVNSIWRANEYRMLYEKRASDGAFVCGELERQLSDRKKEFDNILSTLPARSRENHLTHNKVKRFAMLIPIIASAIGIGLGLHNSKRLGALEGNMEELSNKHNILVDFAQLTGDKIDRLSIDTQLLQQLSILSITHNYHKIMTTMFFLHDHIRNVMKNVEGTLTSSQSNKMSPHMVNGEQLTKLFDKIVEVATARKCKLLVNNPFELYDLESSYGYSDHNQTMYVALHVPMVEEGQELGLKEFIPYPLKQSLKVNATIVPEVGDYRFLAIIPKKDTSSRDSLVPAHSYRVFNTAEIDSCFRLGTVRICAGRNTLHTDIENSCVGSLWLREESLIQKNCEMSISKKQEFVAKMDINKWMVFSPETSARTVECGKETATVRFETQTEITLPEDCKVELRQNILTTDVNLYVDFVTQAYDWRFDGNIFKDDFSNDTELLESIQRIAIQRSKFGLTDLKYLKHNYERVLYSVDGIWDKIMSLDFISWFDSLFIMGVACLVLIFLYVAISNGWHKKLYQCLRGKRNSDMDLLNQMSRSNSLISLATVRSQPVNGQLIRNHLNESLLNIQNGQRVSFGPEEVQIPPPYYSTETLNSEILNPTAPRRPATPYSESIPNMMDLENDTWSNYTNDNNNRAGSFLSLASVFRPVFNRPKLSKPSCNPGPISDKGLKLRDFVCSIHNPKGGCTGHFQKS